MLGFFHRDVWVRTDVGRGVGGLKKSHISNWWSLYYCHPIIIVSPLLHVALMLSCTIHFCPVKFLLVTHCWTYDSIVIADVVFFILNSPHNVLQINHHYSYFAIENYGQKKSPKQILWIKDKKFASWNNENPILEGKQKKCGHKIKLT